MRLLRSFPAMSFTLVLLSIVGLCVAQQSVGLLLIAGTLASMSWYITEGPRGRTLPKWVSNVLVIAVSLNVFVDLFQNRDDVMGVLGRFAVWLTLIKLYERKTARDHSHLLSLSLLLMMTGCLQSTELAFGAVLLVYALLGLYVLLLYQLHASYEQSRSARQTSIPEGYRLVPPLKPIIGRSPGLHFRTLALVVGVLGFGLGLLVFLVFPRDLGANLINSIHTPPRRAVTAFNNSIDLMNSARLNDSRARVCTMQLLDGQGRAFRAGEPLLLRGGVLECYDQGRWTAAKPRTRGIDIRTESFEPLSQPPAEPGSSLTQRFNFIRPVDTLFSLATPIAVSTPEPVRLQFDRSTQTIRLDDDQERLVSYSVRSQPYPSDRTLNWLSMEGRSDWRSFDFDDKAGRVEPLARSLLPADLNPDLKRPRERWEFNKTAAAAFEDHLQSGKFTYTTDLSGIVYRNPDDDPIIRFLFDSHQGHCELFASAMVALCHSVGVQARIVVGYVGWNYDESTQEYVILDSNAHAWVEVRTGSHRWTTYDPTPSSTLRSLHDTPEDFNDRARWTFQQLEANWSSGIVSFDSNTQSRLFDAFESGWSQRLSRTLESIQDWMARVNQSFYFGPAGYIWMGIVAFALVIAVIALVRLMRRSLSIRRTLRLSHVRGSEYQRMLRQLGFYLDMLAVLKRGGIAKPQWQPPMQFADAVHGSLPEVAGLVRQITNVFYLARYGRSKLTRAQMEEARAMVAQLADALRVKR